MKIYANQIATTLKDGLAPCYLLFGDEPFQINDCRLQIKQAAKQQGVEEFIRLSDDDQFEWDELIDHCQSMSLFSSTKLIELELTTGKMPKAGSDAIKQITEQLSAETSLVIFGPKLESSQTRAAWFKGLDKIGIYIPVYEIDGNHLQRWLKDQLAKHKMQMSYEAQVYLLEYTAGNLLAWAQELEKISMALNSSNITLTDVEKLVADQSRYSVFQLIDQLWAGNAKQCINIIERLKLEELEPNIILWALQKDVVLIQQLNQALNYKLDTKSILDSHKVWKNKQALYLNQAKRIPTHILNAAVHQLSQIDQGIKFHTLPCPYSMFAHVCLMLTGATDLANVKLPLDLDLELN
jgi:DNA polymerase-3 subunit delta